MPGLGVVHVILGGWLRCLGHPSAWLPMKQQASVCIWLSFGDTVICMLMKMVSVDISVCEEG